MRYVSVNVAKTPAGKLDDVSAKNKRMCERSPLMPTYDPNIEYITTYVLQNGLHVRPVMTYARTP